MAFLQFGSDGGPALAVFHEADKGKFFRLALIGASLLRKHSLHLVKKFLGNKRRVAALMKFALIAHDAVIKWIA
ncbi:MAG: hypothetical protein A3K83_00180 [Omnitrophica WOR_2 bacterium RBG_13_44_8b]|nr:MAG: hypothetical protein A3K83_00180 [Omnitrophica WOR_2 bacterium RBG_13_44_8b]